MSRSSSVIDRTWLALDGLSVGDAFGQRFFDRTEERALERIAAREVPPAPWTYTDDTEMALSIVEMLQTRGTIEQDALVRDFAARMEARRYYGQGTAELLQKVTSGRDWRALTQASFGGRGSFGNGAAMRIAPLGAYFADEPFDTIVNQARLSAEVTHGHEEGIAGGIAVAVAAALAWRQRDSAAPLGKTWITAVRDATPAGYTRSAIDEALQLPFDAEIAAAASALGNGSGITAPDTIPLCLWVAAHATSFEAALWKTVAALGDRDTTCAIVGGILALKLGRTDLPSTWLSAREALPIERTSARNS